MLRLSFQLSKFYGLNCWIDLKKFQSYYFSFLLFFILIIWWIGIVIGFLSIAEFFNMISILIDHSGIIGLAILFIIIYWLLCFTILYQVKMLGLILLNTTSLLLNSPIKHIEHIDYWRKTAVIVRFSSSITWIIGILLIFPLSSSLKLIPLLRITLNFFLFFLLFIFISFARDYYCRIVYAGIKLLIQALNKVHWIAIMSYSALMMCSVVLISIKVFLTISMIVGNIIDVYLFGMIAVLISVLLYLWFFGLIIRSPILL